MMREQDVNSVSELADFVDEMNREIQVSKYGHKLEMFLDSMSAWLRAVSNSASLPDSVKKNPEVCRAFARILLAARHYD
jgi:hypothetical protein